MKFGVVPFSQGIGRNKDRCPQLTGCLGKSAKRRGQTKTYQHSRTLTQHL